MPSPSAHFGNNGFVKAVFDGWQISGTTSYASGKPKAFGTGTGLNWTYAGTVSATNITDFTGGEVNARPVVVCDPNRNPGTFAPDGTPYLIDTSCFAKPGTIGARQTQRNLIRSLYFNSDIAFFKNSLERSAHSTARETYMFSPANFST